jgi:poly [ADP-ribose] polymerase
VKSTLATPVFDLVSLIFDIKNMQTTMAELEIDLEKMPLGKLSKKTIQQGFRALTDIQTVLEKKPKNMVRSTRGAGRPLTTGAHRLRGCWT